MARRKKKKTAANNTAAIADRLHSAAIHLLRRVRKQDTATGEGPARLSALSVLVFGGSMTLGQLAAAEQVKPPTMSRIVTGLERSRLVTRRADSKDARRQQIRPTRGGERLLHEGKRRRIEYLARNLDRLSPKELETVAEGIQLLESVLHGWLADD
jgi:DNA-binding MarR family transcriptional regulator